MTIGLGVSQTDRVRLNWYKSQLANQENIADVGPIEIHLHKLQPWQQWTCELEHCPDGEHSCCHLKFHILPPWVFHEAVLEDSILSSSYILSSFSSKTFAYQKIMVITADAHIIGFSRRRNAGCFHSFCCCFCVSGLKPCFINSYKMLEKFLRIILKYDKVFPVHVTSVSFMVRITRKTIIIKGEQKMSQRNKVLPVR